MLTLCLLLVQRFGDTIASSVLQTAVLPAFAGGVGPCDLSSWTTGTACADPLAPWARVTCSLASITGAGDEIWAVTGLNLNNCDVNAGAALPVQLSQLTALQSLSMSGTGATGSMPDGYSALQSLTSLDVSRNNLAGALPPSWGYLTQLSNLQVAFNGGVYTTMPDTWSRLTRLTSFVIRGFTPGGVTGTLPNWLGDYTALRSIQIDMRSLSGTLPASWSRLSSLTELEMSSRYNGWSPNSITGQLPDAWFTGMNNLKRLFLQDFYDPYYGRPTLPATLGAATALESLELYCLWAEGGIPASVGQLTRLTRLATSCNWLSSGLGNIRNMPGLTYLDLSDNYNLAGPLPDYWSTHLPQLAILNTLNTATGGGTSQSLPPAWSALSRLQVMYMKNSQLAGTLPPEWSTLTRATYLDFSSSGSLTGPVPHAWGADPAGMRAVLSQLVVSSTGLTCAPTTLQPFIVGSLPTCSNPPPPPGPPSPAPPIPPSVVQSPFNFLDPDLLDQYDSVVGGAGTTAPYVTQLILVYDSTAPGVLVAMRFRFGQAGTKGSQVVTVSAGALYDPTSPTLSEEVVPLPSASPLTDITCCCGAAGSLSGVALTFADGSSAGGGGCAPLRRRQRSLLAASAGGAAAVASGFKLGGVRGSAQAVVGGMSFALVKKIPGSGSSGSGSSPAPAGASPAPGGSGSASAPPLPPAPYTPGRPPLPPRPPSPPPPSPASPSPPPPDANRPVRPSPPPPPPSPTAAAVFKAFTEAIRVDYPVITAGVPTQIPNRFSAATLILTGNAMPVLANGQNDSLVATARYGKGRAAIFGGEAFVTRCCTPRKQAARLARQGRSGRASDPGMDKLISNVAVWAAHYGYKTAGKKAVIRVADKRFAAMAKYVSMTNRGSFQTLQQARIRTFYLDINTFLRGGSENCDLYVIGSYSMSYLDANVRQHLLSFVEGGKGLIIVGPDVMPTQLYDGARAAANNSVPVWGWGWEGGGSSSSSSSNGRRSAMGEEAEAAEEEEEEEEDEEALRAVAEAGTTGRRRLAQSQGVKSQAAVMSIQAPQYNMSAVTVNLVSGPMGLLVSGYVSDPGGNLTLAAPSALRNAELAAQQLVEYLNGRMTLSTPDLSLAMSYVVRTRASLPRGQAGSESFWALSDQLDVVAARRPALPPLSWTFTPPPPPPLYRVSPPPQGGSSWTQSPPPPSAALPAGVVAVGCFGEDASSRLLAVVLLTGDKFMSVERCMSAAANASAAAATRAAAAGGGGGGVAAAGATAAAAPLSYIGIQRTACFGAVQLPSTFLVGNALAAGACGFSCPGAPLQKCGAAGLLTGPRNSSNEFEPKNNEAPFDVEMDEAESARLEAMAKEAYRRAQDVLKGTSQAYVQAQPTTLQSLYDLARTSLASVDSASAPQYELLMAAEGEEDTSATASGADADAPPAAPGGRFGPRVFAFNIEEALSEDQPPAAAVVLDELEAQAARLAQLAAATASRRINPSGTPATLQSLYDLARSSLASVDSASADGHGIDEPHGSSSSSSQQGGMSL
ncbi:hypothetical protein HYH02_003685 [Chlamydomonas schloesseri]|uniref:Uncharacterized protein n=1 Tax=Chlamydomonas schloesseri TaxID=2026947 RepID=A0A836BA54_9CHLO|nr:hypothetical protein HYH02_003685 [Chlamydomonas schloesseri]|eukprot:KAG2451910.1 hypothetical protein HYH02_003685 [Chlamydomonas schloesseri]